MSELTVNTDAYNRLKVPGAIATRLVDEWTDSCKRSSEELGSHPLLAQVDKVRHYLQLADKDVRERGARSKRGTDSRPSSAERDYRDFLMMAIGTIDTIEGISNRRCDGEESSPDSKTSRLAAEVRNALLEMVDAVDGFKGPTLTANERGWLEEYVRQLQKHFPELVNDIFVYTLGDGYPDPEFRTLVLIRDGDRETEKEVSKLGYMIDVSGFYVAPLIEIFTTKEWARRKRIGDPIYEMVDSEGVSVI